MEKPVYQKLIDELKEEIEKKYPNEPVLSERELAVLYSVSRMTVRKALDSLVDEGYLYRIRNKGTFVADEKLRKISPSSTIQSATENDSEHKIVYFNIKVIDDDVAEKMGLPYDELMVRFVRIQKKNEKSQSVDEIHFIKKYMPDNVLDSLEDFDISNFIDCKPLSQSFYPMIVPMKYAKLLELKQGTPIIMIENIVRNNSGIPILFFRTYLNPNERLVQINS